MSRLTSVRSTSSVISSAIEDGRGASPATTLPCRALPRRWVALLMVAMVPMLGSCLEPSGKDDGLDQAIHDAAVAVQIGDVVDLDAAWGGDWDRLLVFDGQPASYMIDDALGFHWSGYTPSMGDGTTILMVDGSSVVRWAYLPAMNDATQGDFVEFDLAEPWVEIRPGDEVVRGDSRASQLVRLCVRVCPPTETD